MESSISDNVDVEDLINSRKRKHSEYNVISKKKLHLLECASDTSQNVFNCEGLGMYNCSSRESKENINRNMNVAKLITTTSSNSEKDQRPDSSEDFLQMIHKPRTHRKIAQDITNGSTENKKSVKSVDMKYEERKFGSILKIDQEKQIDSTRFQEMSDLGTHSGTDSSSKKMLSQEKLLSEHLSVIQSSNEHTNTKKLDVSHEALDNELNGLFDDTDLEKAFTENCFDDLDLSRWQRCEVMLVNEEIPSQNKVVQLRSLSSGAIANCVLRGVWTSCNVIPGTIVSVKAHYESALAVWAVDNNSGFLVEFPDVLISPTTVVGSVSCLRQGVLNFLFSKSALMDENCKIVATGSLIHELIQQIMCQGIDSPECIAALVEEIITSSSNIRLLYSSKISLHEAREELLKVVPHIQKFCKRYSFGGTENLSNNTQKELSGLQTVEEDAWAGQIKSVVAVEDNYWVPELGLKGKVDVTITAKENGQMLHQLMPVELKTGAAKNSIEHRGQVILYCLMASQITCEVSGGLLVYPRETFARKVEVGRPEQRDIILLRNRIAQYVAPFFSSLNNKEFFLPHTTNNSRICEWCPQKIVCSSFLSASREEMVKTSAQELRTASIGHLAPQHLEYIVHWSNLLWLEEKDKPKNSLTDLWTLSAQKREAKGQCLCNLKLSGPVKFKDINSYIHVFHRKNGTKLDFRSRQFSSGSLVLISTDCRIAIAFGIIEEYSDFFVTVNVPRDLSQVSNLYGDSYSIDVYEPQSYLHWVLGNLAALLDDVETAANLRRLIIDRDAPLFEFTCEHSSELKIISQFNLNDLQYSAIRKALGAKDFLILKGLPGTGKSTTIAVLIHQLVSQGNSVLLTAHTHSAVDTVLLKLLKLNVPFMRIGSQVRVHEAVRSWTDHNLTKHCSTPEELEITYNKQSVVAATCLGVKHSLFIRRLFDVCIVDESTQVLQPVILGPLLHTKKFILVGDPEQLPPVVRNTVASERGLSKCLFTHLAKPEATVSLSLQYRMNSRITDLANDLTYGGELKCANAAVSEATLQLTTEKIQDSIPSWLSKAFSCKTEDSVLFIDVPYSQENVLDRTNKKEALLVKKLTDLFLQAHVTPDSIGVMAPYHDQVKHLTSVMKSIPEIEINTVDQYQGRDKDIIIFSCTNYWSTHNTLLDNCILNDKRRLTVAITRAKLKLIIIGCQLALRCFTPLQHIISSIGSQNIVQIPDFCEEFILSSN